MLKSKGLRNVLLTILAFCSMEFIAQGSPVEFSNRNWSLYPKDASVKFEEDKTARDDKNVFGKITSQETVSRFSIYTYIPMQGNKSCKISFQYMAKEGPAASVELVLSFNKKNGKHGSAGSVRFPVTINGNQEWQTFSTGIQIPPETELCQFAIDISEFKGTFLVGNLSIEDVKDSFAINMAATEPVIDGRLDDGCWKNAVPLQPFYCLGNKVAPANATTTAFIAYDNKNIYIAIKNSEPQPDKILHKIKERDGSLWEDDCNEIFIAVSNNNIFQFITNSDGVQWDGRLFVKVPGDPYSADAEWNGVWKSASIKDKDSWTTEICIPFSTLQMPPKEGDKWYINLARERKVAAEMSHFNRGSDAFNNAAKFACLTFSKNFATLKRYSEATLTDPFKIVRKSPQFQELLSARPGNYVLGSWSGECSLSAYPPGIREKYTPATFAKEQDAVLTEFGEAGLLGPVAYPWAPGTIGMERIKDFNKKYNTKYWFSLINSSHYKKAIENGAKFYSDKQVDPTDPELQKIIEEFIKDYFLSNKDKLSYLQFILGKDEPMNNTYLSYSITKNKMHKDALLELDARIKQEFGFGKYGLYDAFANQENPELAPFNMIAFMRWWNKTFAAGLEKQSALVHEYAPGIQFQACDINCVRAMCNEDAALLSQYTDCVSVDPYPTSAMYNYGRNRALYHTGFSLKIEKDLAGGKPISGILQAFSYCGGTPVPENLREWASQALKNGADVISWYASSGAPIRVSLPDIYKETLRISNIVHKMNKVNIPSETQTAIFFSCPTYWGNFDKAAHSYYTVYSILGENLKTWFRFVSDSEIKLKIDDLSKYRLVYVPHLKFTDAGTAAMLLEYVKNGGRLVIFDPEAFTWNIDGTKLEKLRGELIGCSTGKAVDVKSITASTDYSGLKKGDELPLTPLAHIANAGKVMAFEITPPAGAKIIANYPDGKPAAFERTVGKGSVIYFAAQPFGNSDLAVKDSPWSTFMKNQAEQTGEKLNLPIWDFELPAKGGEIEVKYVIKPN